MRGLPIRVDLALVFIPQLFVSTFRKGMILSIIKVRGVLNLFSSSQVISIPRNLFISPSSVNTNFSHPFFIDLMNPLMSIIDGSTMIQSWTYVKTITPFPMYEYESIYEALILGQRRISLVSCTNFSLLNLTCINSYIISVCNAFGICFSLDVDLETDLT